MKNAIEKLIDVLESNSLLSCTFSSPRTKQDQLKTIVIQALNNNDSSCKVEYRYTKHNDIKTTAIAELKNDLIKGFLTSFKQCHIKTKTDDIQILLNKKLNAKIISKSTKENLSTTHNRKKNYLIPEGIPCPFLIKIGVMSPNGSVKPNYYKKFKQINRFLEMVDDLFKVSKKDNFHIVDFGCGKSYLTFAIYHYFQNIKNAQVKITGIDLKEEVINHCNTVAQELNFINLKFVHGFIHDFKTEDPIDFVVTLHACDTATDDAILFSLRNHAESMIFVPCCQHELNNQLKNESSSILLKHGIFKDRMTALVTDTMRSHLLEICGYKVQSMEFIEMEHTAKNIMLRCTKLPAHRTKEQQAKLLNQYTEFKKQWSIDSYLEQSLIKEEFINF